MCTRQQGAQGESEEASQWRSALREEEAVGARLGRMEQRGEVLSAAELGASGEMN